MPWWYPWIKAARYMNGAVGLVELIEMPLGPVWRDRILIAQLGEAEAKAILAKRKK